MEFFIVSAVVIIIIVFIARSPSSQSSTTRPTSQHAAEQLKDREYKIIKQLAKLSTESSNIICNLQATDADMRRHEKLKTQITELEKERNSISSKLSKANNTTEQATQELNSLLHNHVKLVMLLIKKKGFTEEQANTAILNKIELRQRQYQIKGLSEEQALEKAGRDVYRLAEQSSEFFNS